MTTNLYIAHIMLLIWNPDIWCLHPDMRTRTQLRLKYKAYGIVLHDRALNGERVELSL